jgi:phosphotransferase system enzyme I (PtsP)
MMAQHFPRLDTQVRHYRGILAAANERSVTFRTLDIGADKLLPYLRQVKEDNPAMGWRAIRVALDRPALLRLQLRALLKAGAGQKLRIMFPMIAEVSEFLAAKAMVDKEKAHLKAHGHRLPAKIELGAMVEVPALVWQLDQLLPELDFVSIGSNDLVQFLYASDRQNPRLAQRYDPLSPAVLKTIRMIVQACEAHGVHVNLCGEMAGRPLEAMTLIGLGLRSISMVPAAIGPVKTMILSTDRAKLWAFMEPLLQKPDHSLRLALTAYAKSQGIRLI